MSLMAYPELPNCVSTLANSESVKVTLFPAPLVEAMTSLAFCAATITIPLGIGNAVSFAWK